MKDTKQSETGDRVETMPPVKCPGLNDTTVKAPQQRWHTGYKEARFISLLFEGVPELEIAGGVDYVSLSDLKPPATTPAVTAMPKGGERHSKPA